MPSLQVMILNSTQFSALYNDHGSGADYDLQTWRPVPPTGFFSLGDHAESASGYPIYGSSPLGAVVVAKDITESQTALAAPTGFNLVWTDKGSGAYMDGSIWMPVPPPGYVPLGCIVQVGDSMPSTDVMMCVRQDLVSYGSTGSLVWSDSGSGADKNVTIWSSSLKPSVTPPPIDVGAFMANESYDLYTGPFYLLNSNEVDWVTNEDSWGSTIQNLIGNLSVGYAYAVAVNGAIWSSGGYGYARAPWEVNLPSVPMTATTPMHLASISKLITALALASLIENNLETMLNTPFWQCLESNMITTWGENVQTITLADLLGMKSGMPQPTEAIDADYWQAMNQWCAKDAIAGAIGIEYDYNNNNYAILQGVIEYLYQQSTGNSLDYAGIVQETVFGPTGVTGIVPATPLPPTLTYDSQNLTDHNAGYEWSNFVALMAAGGWIGSALDLTTFMAGVMNYQVVGETTLQALMSEKYGFLVSGTMSNGVVSSGMNGLLYTGGNEPPGLNTAVQYFPQVGNGPAPMIVSLLINTTDGPGGGALWQPATIWAVYNELYNANLPVAQISRPRIRTDTSAVILL